MHTRPSKMRAIVRNNFLSRPPIYTLQCNVAINLSRCRPRPAEMAEILYFSSSLEAIIDTFRASYIISTYSIVDFSKQISLCFYLLLYPSIHFFLNSDSGLGWQFAQKAGRRERLLYRNGVRGIGKTGSHKKARVECSHCIIY